MDNDDELKAKACEMAEMLFEHHGQEKEMIIRHFLPGVEEQVREFYVEHGQLPVFRRDLGGHRRSIVMVQRTKWKVRKLTIVTLALLMTASITTAQH